MGIKSVSIEKLVFKHGFDAEFCRGVNVLIGGNGTGKTTIIREMYYMVDRRENCFDDPPELAEYKRGNIHTLGLSSDGIAMTFYEVTNVHNLVCAFIPEKDILEHAMGLLAFIEDKYTGFSEIYRKVLVKATGAIDKMLSEMQKSVGEKISSIIGGHVEWVQGEGTFYMIKDNGERIAFAHEASGYKRLGYLGLLVACGQIEEGSVLFWDEPENSLNPEIYPKLAEILLELARGGVQIFIATHSEILASYLAVCRQVGDDVLFHSLYKEGGQVKVNSSDRFDLLEPNNLKAEPVKLYKMEIVKGLGSNG